MRAKQRVFRGTRKTEGRLWRNENKKAKLHLLRQSDCCALCGNKILAMHDATVDHIIPLSKGGSDTPSNMQIAHRDCNTKKGNSYVEPIQTFLNTCAAVSA